MKIEVDGTPEEIAELVKALMEREKKVISGTRLPSRERSDFTDTNE